MIDIGHVANIVFKFPQDETREDGLKPRACTVIEHQATDGQVTGLFVVPHHGVVPGQAMRPLDAKYGIKLGKELQAQLGLRKTDRDGITKESWILPHRANLVQVPQNPAVRRVVDKRGEKSWAMGPVPASLVEDIRKRQKEAIENGDFRIMAIRNTNPPTDRHREAGRPRSPRDPEGILERRERSAQAAARKHAEGHAVRADPARKARIDSKDIR